MSFTHLRHRLIPYTLIALIGLTALDMPLRVASAAQDDVAPPPLKPAVAALLHQATDAYKQMHTYRHTAEFVERGRPNAEPITAFTLALERPNRFCYQSDNANDDVAVSDGKVFTNYQVGPSGPFYTRSTAPASFSRIDLVEGVFFRSLGTYVIALMLQGDALADRGIRTYMEKIDAPKSVTEDGVRYDTLSGAYGLNGFPLTLYFDGQTHLLHKAVLEVPQSNLKFIEIIENVKIDKPIPSDLFQYTPPKNALWII